MRGALPPICLLHLVLNYAIDTKELSLSLLANFQQHISPRIATLLIGRKLKCLLLAAVVATHALPWNHDLHGHQGEVTANLHAVEPNLLQASSHVSTTHI
jgi:hypothetical protein